MTDLLELIQDVHDRTHDLSDKYQVTIMSNTRSKTRKINGQNIQYTDQNEFFSDAEFTEIYNGIQEAGFFTHASFNELSLMQKILEESYFENNQIIYNLSRNGRHAGKKSMMPAFLDLLNIPYTGSNPFVISLCREKYKYTKYLQAHGIYVPESYIYLGNGQWLNNERPKSTSDFIVKPVQESASIGLSQNSILSVKEDNINELENRLLQYNSPVLIQQFIRGSECEVPLFVSSTGEVATFDPIGVSMDNKQDLQSEILTYERSFNDDYEFYEFHERIGKEKAKILAQDAAKIAQLIGIAQYGRVDFRVDNTGKAYLIDIAASPYTTKHSSFAFAFEHLNLPYEKIYSTIIGLAYLNHSSKSK